MSTRVAELYVPLTLDDSQFTAAMGRNQQGLQRLGTIAATSSNTVAQSGRTAAAGLDTIAQSANRASTATNGIALNSSLSAEAQKAVAEYHNLQAAADKFANAALTAHDKARNAADTQRVAEERLGATYSNSSSTARDVAEAESAVARARDLATRAAQASSTAADQMEASSRRAGQAARDSAGDIETAARESRAAMEEAAQAATRSGEEAGSGFAEGLAGRMRSGVDRASSAAGSLGGDNFLSSFASKVSDLAGSTGPIAGSILGVAVIGLAAGAALAGAIKDGMQTELTQDMFQAQTGVTESQAQKYGLAAGEAYANAFGESIEGNLDTAKSAIENGLLDPASTQRDAQAMIESLDGVAAIIGEEIPAVSRAAGQALKTGFAVDANDAFDLIVKGSQMGLNASEDWLDTINEYGTQFRKLGLSGADSIGLMSQAVKAGARDTDVAADVLKEFSIRAIDASELTGEGFAALGYEIDGVAASQGDLTAANGEMANGFAGLGFNAEEMGDKVAAGGESAREALGQVLDRLRGIEDPAERAAAATALFGTQSEDLGDALYAMDLDTATQALSDYEGAAKSAIDVMGDNAFSSVAGAMNGISVAVDGIKAGLAQAFGPYIQDFANTISNNRAGVIQFFIDIANTGFDAAGAIAEFVGKGLIGLSEFAQAGTDMSVSFMRSIADMLGGLDMIGSVLSIILPGFSMDTGSMADKLNTMADTAETAGNATADGLRTAGEFMSNEMPGHIDVMQDRFNKIAVPLKDSAAFNDVLTKLNSTITEIGVNTDGELLKFDAATWTGELDKAIPAQAAMADSLAGLEAQFQEQVRAGLTAGATVEELTAQYNGNRDALITQAMQMGLTNTQALALVDSYNLTPELINTQINTPGMPEALTNLDLVREFVTTNNQKDVLVSDTSESTMAALASINATVLNGKIVPVDADDEQAWRDIRALTDPKSVIITAEVRKSRMQLGMTDEAWTKAMNDAAAYRASQNANGSVRVDDAFANGGNTLPADATIQQPRSRLVQWAEPETGGEAFIPLTPAKRNRSVKILADVARRFGLSLLPKGAAQLLDGNYDGSLRQVGIEEDHPIVNGVLGAHSLIGSGNYDGQLRKLGIEEDNPLVDALLNIHSATKALGFADGGVLENAAAQRAIEAAKAPSGIGYEYGKLDCSGYQSAIYNAFTGEDVRFTTASDFAALGFVEGPDPSGNGYNIGTDGGTGMQGHMAGSVFGVPVESGGAHGTVAYGGDAADENTFSTNTGERKVWHLPRSKWNPPMGDDPATESGSYRDKSSGSDSPSSSSSLSSSSQEGGGDGQRVYVTNWPGSSAPAEEERKPKGQFAATWFADGGFGAEDHSAHVAQGLRIFGEPETGGEAYIPLSAAKRGRSKAILGEVARRFGMNVYADGGFGGVGNDSGSGEHIGSWEVLKSAPQGDVPLSAPRKDAGLAVWASEAYKAVSAGVGLALTAASGFDSSGKFVGFNTGNNTIPGFDKVLEQLTEIAAKPTVVITKAEINDPAGIVRDVVDESGLANLAILQTGI